MVKKERQTSNVKRQEPFAGLRLHVSMFARFSADDTAGKVSTGRLVELW